MLQTTLCSCFQWFKDTNLKANHNTTYTETVNDVVVSNGSKILIWKQITTLPSVLGLSLGCFQWFKDTNLKANHNRVRTTKGPRRVVSNGSKILIWKQITTYLWFHCTYYRCFQWFKDTNLKANHNKLVSFHICRFVVSNGSKILIWKQITTFLCRSLWPSLLFPMVQRY